MNNKDLYVTFICFVLILLTIAFIFWIHIDYQSKIAIEAIKAGLVQQSTLRRETIWVKPEDYKPYPVDSLFNLPSNQNK